MRPCSLDQLSQLIQRESEPCVSVYLNASSWPKSALERRERGLQWLLAHEDEILSAFEPQIATIMQENLQEWLQDVASSVVQGTVCAFVYSDETYHAVLPGCVDEQIVIGSVAHLIPLFRLRQTQPHAVVVQQTDFDVTVSRFAWGELTPLSALSWPCSTNAIKSMVRKEMYWQGQMEPAVSHPVILLGSDIFLEQWQRETEFSQIIFYPSHLVHGSAKKVVMELLEQAVDEEIGSLAQTTYRGVLDGTGVVGYGEIQAALQMKNLESLMVAEDLQTSKERTAPIAKSFSVADAMVSISQQDALIKDCMARGIEVYFLPKSKMPEQLPLLGSLRDGFQRPQALAYQSAYLQ